MKHLAGWKSVLVGSGAQCVMTIGIIEMLLLSVDNLDSIQKVSHSGDKMITINMRESV